MIGHTLRRAIGAGRAFNGPRAMWQGRATQIQQTEISLQMRQFRSSAWMRGSNILSPAMIKAMIEASEKLKAKGLIPQDTNVALDMASMGKISGNPEGMLIIKELVDTLKKEGMRFDLVSLLKLMSEMKKMERDGIKDISELYNRGKGEEGLNHYVESRQTDGGVKDQESSKVSKVMEFFKGFRNLVDSTPAKDQTHEDIAPAEAEEMRKRRARLARHFKDKYEIEPFDNFLGNIGELDTYNDFVNEKSGEDALMDYIFALCDKMDEKASKVAEHNIPQNHYILADHQKKPIPGSSHKADGVFYYSRPRRCDISTVHMFIEAKVVPTPGSLPIEIMGQIIDYVNAVWTDQPTRTFVPILYLHGQLLTLFVFTRGPWYRVELGTICYTSVSPKYRDKLYVRETLLCLWFIITLPPERFGHFCDVDTGLQSIRFDRTNSNDKLAHASPATPKDSSAVSLRLRIPRTVNPRSRLAYLFDTSFKSKRSVLKLSWTPVRRLPKGAIYEILHMSGIDGVPKVYDSGLLVDNLYGYRLEYIILEHCGHSIASHVKDIQNGSVPGSDIHKQIGQLISQVSRCLVQARFYGVLHCDISDGNIAVSNGQAKVIDWGYAKVIEASPVEARGVSLSVVDRVAQQWGFEKESVLKNEAASDHMIGTVLFMSIPVLFGMKKRSLSDDIESLFYVIIRAFATSEECCGFKHYDNSNLALARVGILGCPDNYLGVFNAGDDIGDLKQTLDAMHRYLFYSGGRYIGHDLVSNENYERLPDLAMAARFMDEKTSPNANKVAHPP
ncbi:hypothetical protein GGI11_002863 [Coemansia sp. RSA 2049]|nr:hypothetical protein GGI11_002863 [Coemansia sp. RSA 2049]